MPRLTVYEEWLSVGKATWVGTRLLTGKAGTCFTTCLQGWRSSGSHPPCQALLNSLLGEPHPSHGAQRVMQFIIHYSQVTVPFLAGPAIQLTVPSADVADVNMKSPVHKELRIWGSKSRLLKQPQSPFKWCLCGHSITATPPLAKVSATYIILSIFPVV